MLCSDHVFGVYLIIEARDTHIEVVHSQIVVKVFVTITSTALLEEFDVGSKDSSHLQNGTRGAQKLHRLTRNTSQPFKEAVQLKSYPLLGGCSNRKAFPFYSYPEVTCDDFSMKRQIDIIDRSY